jgi:hypothetical protein
MNHHRVGNKKHVIWAYFSLKQVVEFQKSKTISYTRFLSLQKAKDWDCVKQWAGSSL